MSFTAEQVEQLLKPINPRRVMHANGQSHLSQQDVRAHLIRAFGFDGWDKEILELRCIRDDRITVPGKPAQDGKPATPDRKDVPAVTYLCRLRLTVRDPAGLVVKVSEDVGTGTSPNLPSYGDAHDFAAKNAVSYALKRCATDLGDQFGLSLYNKGQTKALVMDTIVRRAAAGEHARTEEVDEGVPEQVSLGDDEGGGQPEPEPPDDWVPTATNGGGKRINQTADPASESTPVEPEPPSVPDAVWRQAFLKDIPRLWAALGQPAAEMYAEFARTHGSTVDQASTTALGHFREQLRVKLADATAAPKGDGEDFDPADDASPGAFHGDGTMATDGEGS